jgi:hypothetical protein
MKKSDEPTSIKAAEPPLGLAAEGNGGLPGSTGAARAASSSNRTWALALAAGLAAGVIGGAIAEAALTPISGARARVYDYTGKSTAPAKEALPDSGLLSSLVNSASISPAAEVGLRNALVSYGTLGAALGLGLGLAGGLIHRSVFRGVLAGATGLVFGGVTGVAMARVLAPVFYRNLTADDLTYSLIVHGGIWGAVGAVAGLAFRLGLGGWGLMLRVMVGGAGAAVLAAAIYEFAGGVLFPGAMTNLPVSVTWQTRLAAQLLVTLLVATGVVLAAESGGPGSGEAKVLKNEARLSGGTTTSG